MLKPIPSSFLCFSKTHTIPIFGPSGSLGVAHTQTWWHFATTCGCEYSATGSTRGNHQPGGAWIRWHITVSDLDVAPGKMAKSRQTRTFQCSSCKSLTSISFEFSANMRLVLSVCDANCREFHGSAEPGPTWKWWRLRKETSGAVGICKVNGWQWSIHILSHVQWKSMKHPPETVVE